MRLLRLTCLTLILTLLFAKQGICQSELTIAGQVPKKWITVKHSLSPNRTVYSNGQNYEVDFEDIYAKIWLPLVLHDRFKMAAAASYRTEQIEFETQTNSDLNTVNHWNLRAAGLDFKSSTRLSERNSLIVGANFSYSATIQSISLRSSPLNYSISAVFMQRRSQNKEIGFGLLHSGNSNSFPFLPIIIWNETFSKRNGIEISLPYKLAWRHNLSERSIFHIKAEGISRSYFVDQTKDQQCRRVDVDFGVAYIRLLNKWVGFEVFGAFRQNLASELPNDMYLKTSSGFAISAELFIIAGFKSKKSKD